MFKLLWFIVLAAFPVYSEQNLRIANGYYVGQFTGYGMQNIGELPFVVHLDAIIVGSHPNKTEYLSRISCGGSIIKPNVILTAAHCVVLTVAENITVYAGSLNNRFPRIDPGLQIADVRRIVSHKYFDFDNPANDIALLFLLYPLEITSYVNTIELPTRWDYRNGLQALAAGWGMDQYRSNSDWLQKAHLVQVSRRVCQYYSKMFISDSMTCAIDPRYITAICKGDSGGPLVSNGHLVGITSFAAALVYSSNNQVTCSPRVPTVFLKVLSFVPWISSKIQEDTTLVGDIR